MNSKTHFVKLGSRGFNPACIEYFDLDFNLDTLDLVVADKTFQGTKICNGVEVRFISGISEYFSGEEAEVVRKFLNGNQTYDLNQIYGQQQ